MGTLNRASAVGSATISRSSAGPKARTARFGVRTILRARFILQWVVSERHKKSVVPHAFWYLSIGGGVTLLTYAIYRLDPIFILGEAFGLLVFLRNLHFIRRRLRVDG